MPFLLDDLDTAQLLFAANTLVVAFSKNLNAADTDILANLIVSIVDILALISRKDHENSNSN